MFDLGMVNLQYIWLFKPKKYIFSTIKKHTSDGWIKYLDSGEPKTNVQNKTCLHSYTLCSLRIWKTSKISIQITILNQKSTNLICSWFPQIRDGSHDGSPQIGRYCGNVVPQSEIVSTSGNILVHLSTDGDIELSGFQLTITTQLSK